MIEIWRDIKDYEGLYQVSNFGRVRSLNYNKTGEIKIMKLKKTRDGYLRVGLRKNGKQKWISIHRLVAEAFIPNPLNLPCVNHKIEGEEGKKINTVENLEWCTYKYNTNYGTCIERGRKKTVKWK